MMRLLIFSILLMPVVEIFVFVRVSQYFGFLNAVIALLATSFLGGFIARTQGMMVYKNVQDSMARGQLPPMQLIQSFMVFVGGILLAIPGFVTDVIGLLFVLPGFRHILAGVFGLFIKRAIRRGTMGVFSNAKGFHWHSASYTSPERDVSPYQRLDRQGVIDVTPVSIDSEPSTKK